MFDTVGLPTFPFNYEAQYTLTSANSRTPNTYGYYTSLKEVPQRSKGETYNGSWQAFAMNDYVFRYTDVMLMRAEALAKQNTGKDEIMSLVNQVRQRAKVADIVLGDYPTKESLRDFILAERGREFFSEGLRREDLIRHGKFISNAIERGKNAKPYHVLYPIPQRQREANPNLAQNPGYEGAE